MSIKFIKNDLKDLGILETCYDEYDSQITDTDLCSVDDFLVQMWFYHVKNRLSSADILKRIPKNQNWFKKILVRSQLGRKVINWSILREALDNVKNEPSDQYRDYQREYFPIGERIIST